MKMDRTRMDREHLIFLAKQHASIDYTDENSAEESAIIVDALRSLIKDALVNDPYELQELLNVEVCASWVAFTALESVDLEAPFKSKCLSQVRKVARSGGINAIGAQIWLDQHGFTLG